LQNDRSLLVRLSAVFVAMSWCVAKIVTLKIVIMQPDTSLDYRVVGRDHTGNAYKIAVKDAKKTWSAKALEHQVLQLSSVFAIRLYILID